MACTQRQLDASGRLGSQGLGCQRLRAGLGDRSWQCSVGEIQRDSSTRGIGEVHLCTHGSGLAAGDGQAQPDAATLGNEALRTGFQNKTGETGAVVEDFQVPRELLTTT